MGGADSGQEALISRVMASQKLHQALNVADDLNPIELKRLFRKTRLKIHPDKCRHPRATEAFQRLGSLASVLEDDKDVSNNREVAAPSDWEEGSTCGSWGSESSNEELDVDERDVLPPKPAPRAAPRAAPSYSASAPSAAAAKPSACDASSASGRNDLDNNNNYVAQQQQACVAQQQQAWWSAQPQGQYMYAGAAWPSMQCTYGTCMAGQQMQATYCSVAEGGQASMMSMMQDGMTANMVNTTTTTSTTPCDPPQQQAATVAGACGAATADCGCCGSANAVVGTADSTSSAPTTRLGAAAAPAAATTAGTPVASREHERDAVSAMAASALRHAAGVLADVGVTGITRGTNNPPAACMASVNPGGACQEQMILQPQMQMYEQPQVVMMTPEQQMQFQQMQMQQMMMQQQMYLQQQQCMQMQYCEPQQPMVMMMPNGQMMQAANAPDAPPPQPMGNTQSSEQQQQQGSHKRPCPTADSELSVKRGFTQLRETLGTA